MVDTLTPLEASRRAYRLVGGVLVERTVGEVLPSVKTNQEGIKQLLQQLAKSQADKELAATKWKVRALWKMCRPDIRKALTQQACLLHHTRDKGDTDDNERMSRV